MTAVDGGAIAYDPKGNIVSVDARRAKARAQATTELSIVSPEFPEFPNMVCRAVALR